ncbi:hypothetical protein BDY17DRAFT_302975 [Neohortaea acidophila]|uniref:Uncharacterized protein n=1 Tax=Neohortaea acidophila TaxID=245834 RepID=A0A6A6PJI7_9PEZI|nr:uncharacterized protein BDY17DRAFT_302975 [Neohortaea acidophila]KAF2479956.1 hypothetical protein BDY17DRAFT_302975 [Neohortaea acidophila]
MGGGQHATLSVPPRTLDPERCKLGPCPRHSLHDRRVWRGPTRLKIQLPRLPMAFAPLIKRSTGER